MLRPSGCQQSASRCSISASHAYLKYTAGSANKGIGIGTEPRHSINHSKKTHVLKEGGLGKCDTDDRRRITERQLANEANGEADPKIVPVPLLVL